jgi:hypothetical protein
MYIFSVIFFQNLIQRSKTDLPLFVMPVCSDKIGKIFIETRLGHETAPVHFHLRLHVHAVHHHHRLLQHQPGRLSGRASRRQWGHLNHTNLATDRFHSQS